MEFCWICSDCVKCHREGWSIGEMERWDKEGNPWPRAVGEGLARLSAQLGHVRLWMEVTMEVGELLSQQGSWEKSKGGGWSLRQMRPRIAVGRQKLLTEAENQVKERSWRDMIFTIWKKGEIVLQVVKACTYLNPFSFQPLLLEQESYPLVQFPRTFACVLILGSLRLGTSCC